MKNSGGFYLILENVSKFFLLDVSSYNYKNSTRLPLGMLLRRLGESLVK